MVTIGLQELFLNSLRRQRIPAVFYLINGFQMKGLVKAFDNYTLVMESDGAQKLLFKHAISTIVPFQPVELEDVEEKRE